MRRDESTFAAEAFNHKKQRGQKRQGGGNRRGKKGFNTQNRQDAAMEYQQAANPTNRRRVVDFAQDEEMKGEEEETKQAKPVAPTQSTQNVWAGFQMKSQAVPSQSMAVNQNLDATSQPGKQKMSRLILWLRNDLRMHDNPVLAYAARQANPNTQVVPVFCFDPRFFTKAQPQFMMDRKTGIHRTRFMIESVQDLRGQLRAIGSGLFVSTQKPEEFLQTLVRPDQDTTLVFAAETCSEERSVEDRVEQALKDKGVSRFVDLWGNTLVHIDDLPERMWNKFPTSATAFMRMTDNIDIRPVCPTPQPGQLPLIEASQEAEAHAADYLPSLTHDFGFTEEEVAASQDSRTCLEFRGGERAGLQRVAHYFFDKKCLKQYKKTRNGMIGADYSSKFSPWLANGCLSVRKMYYDILKFEQEVAKNESSAHFYFELRWREFFRFYCEAHQTAVFWQQGIRPEGQNGFAWRSDQDLITRWKEGTTGMPIVDAFMRELKATGFMSNRGRQIVASYLALDLQQDWRFGAHHFEELLLDHDVHSNYGNWNAAAGVGPGRVNYFNVLRQSHQYDRKGEFIRLWVPELRDVPESYIHDPWNMPRGQRKKLKLTIGDELEAGNEILYPALIPVQKYTHPDAMRQARGGD